MGKIYQFNELPSTNEFAKSISKEADEWTIVIADKQTQGKGRLNKIWYSPTGGLWFSIILRPQNFLVLPLCVGVAVCETIRELGLKNAQIKWPNDILIHGKKVAGILSEFVVAKPRFHRDKLQSRLSRSSGGSGGDEGTVIVGVGINLNIREFPNEIENTATSLLLEKGKTYDKEKVFDRVRKRIKEKYTLIEANKQQEIITEFKSLSITLGKRVKIETPNGCLEGKAIDIDSNGALILKLPTGKTEKIFAGCSEAEIPLPRDECVQL
ncbi:MAG: biotin--[acetyl-CoA-carboxylase] ligase [Candidatus Stahlbacteria bacterium]|nr:biotin--[acetyl-CoA-carboxylase] ligase [Candidatus Stahlbacteria bacterium]